MIEEIDLEDYIEEVKFQMTEWDGLDEDIILDWEEKAREWVDTHQDKRMIKKHDEVTLLVKDEDIYSELARLYYRAVRDGKEREYWAKFHILGKQ